MPVPFAPISSALRVCAVCAVLLAGTVLLYLPSLSNGFVIYDDPLYVTNNAMVQQGFTRESLAWAFVAPGPNWHPLTWYSHMLDWELYGESAIGHHFTSALLHAVNALLVFLVGRRLMGSFWTAALAAALFAWHPLRVESVAWVAERKDVLSGFFFLLTLLAYHGYAGRRTRGEPTRGWLVLTLGGFVLGLMSKPMLVSLPLVLLVLDFWPLRRAELTGPWTEIVRQWRPLLVEKIPFVLLAFAVSVATLVLQREGGAFTLTLPWTARVANAFMAVPRYLADFFYPTGLIVAYPHPGQWPALLVAGAAGLLFAITGLAWWQRQARPWLLAGWAWTLITFLPVIGLVQVGFQSKADRYTYLPLLGWTWLLLWSWRELRPGRWGRMVSAVVGSTVLAGCACLTWQQQAVWKNSVTLFEHALAHTEQKEVAEDFLGYAHLSEGRLAKAEEYARRAIGRNGGSSTALYTLGEVCERQGRLVEAEGFYRGALAKLPGTALYGYHLGMVLWNLGKRDEAVGYLRAAVRRDRSFLEASVAGAERATAGRSAAAAEYYWPVITAIEPEEAKWAYGYGMALLGIGRQEEALDRFRTAVRLEPQHAMANLQVGMIFLVRGDTAAAEPYFRSAQAKQPDLGAAWFGLGLCAEAGKRPTEAEASFVRAIELDPNNALVRVTWGELLARRKRFTDAVPHYRRATELQPQNAEAFAGLGYVLFLSERRAEALACWEEALRLDPRLPGLAERVKRLREGATR